MTHTRTGLFGAVALLGTLGACAAPPAAGGGGNLATLPSPPAAEAAQHPGPGWLLLGTTEDGALFMHPLSTVRVGSSAFIMVVANRRTPVALPSGASIGSVRERIEIDCDKRRYRRFDGTAHPDGVALGPVLGQVGREQWREISPNTVMAAVSSAVCSATAPGGAAPDKGAPPPPPGMPRFPRDRRGTFTT